MARNLFVYGTLTFPEIVKALTGKTFAAKPATLTDYFVSMLPDRPYPGLVKCDGDIADGQILCDIDEKSFRRISEWEDDEYVCQDIQAETSDGVMRAKAFIWRYPPDSLVKWNRKAFAEDYISVYVDIQIPKFLKTIDKKG